MAGKGGVPHNKERRQQVVALRAQGLSLAAIGRLLDPPVSRQRVLQMLDAYYLTEVQDRARIAARGGAEQ